MIGLVIVSHSAKLAEGICDLAQQMTQNLVPIAVAGGIDDAENPIGTDPMKVVAAIESVYSDDGVVILIDLGSALLSAETALEFIAPEQKECVFLCPAPLVEGVMAAAVQAMVGSTIDEVMHEAQNALTAKMAQMEPFVPEPSATTDGTVMAETAVSLTITIPNKLGLHARPAARLVQLAAQFDADITIDKSGQTANAKSMNQVATLGARQGDSLTFHAAGTDADEALATIQTLANENFGDDDSNAENPEMPATMPTTPVNENERVGIAASDGIGIGAVVKYEPKLPPVVENPISDPNAEWGRLQTAIRAAVADLDHVVSNMKLAAGTSSADIFTSHQLLLQDPELHNRAQHQIEARMVNAEAVWQMVIAEVAASFRKLHDPYLQERANDVEDVGQRVLMHLMDVTLPSLDITTPHILAARDLTPSDTAQLNAEYVMGIITEVGGATSHSAILARSLNIPAVVGTANVLSQLDDGQLVGLDGSNGRIILTPDNGQLETLEEQREQWLKKRRAQMEIGQSPAVTKDGRSIEIVANISSLADVDVALKYGAEGVGLFRTEFLFMDRQAPPTEDEQYRIFTQVAEKLNGRSLIIRTLDIGGDKQIPYMGIPAEDNPFLGWRGIRFCLDKPDIFKPHLRAICRVSANHDVRVMFPMIGTLDELNRAKQMLQDVWAELEENAIPFNPEMQVGIMIELPTAVLIADQLAQAVDFFSIGTNDLTQYTMAADRGNARVAPLADALQPAVLRAIKQTVDAAHQAGIWVGMCGELAGNPLATPILVGLGLDELSMSAPAIPAVKQQIQALTSVTAQKISERTLSLNTSNAISTYLSNLSDL